MKTTTWLLVGCLALAMLTGCGDPKIRIVLLEGEPIVPEFVQGSHDGWKTLAKRTVAASPTAEFLAGREAHEVKVYQTKQQEAQGLKYTFSSVETALDAEGQRMVDPDAAFTVYYRFTMDLTNVSDAPIGVERIEALTLKLDIDQEPGKVIKSPEGDVYAILLDDTRWFFVMESPTAKVEVENRFSIEGKRSQILKVWQPVEAAIAPGETWTYHAVLGCVRSTSEEAFTKAFERYRDREVRPAEN